VDFLEVWEDLYVLEFIFVWFGFAEEVMAEMVCGCGESLVGTRNRN
jgi:hypothetical protein